MYERSSGPPRPQVSLDVSSPSRSAKRLWMKLAGGALTDLNLSGDGSAILAATSPDPDVKGNLKQYLLTRYNRAGKIVWRKKQRGQVKSQAISRDASWVFVANYLDDLTAYGPGGQVRWRAEAVCRPYFLDPASKVLCFHDDDAEPQIAFDVFDLKGKKVKSEPTSRDVLGIKIAKDATVFAISQIEGHLSLYSGADFKALWERKVEGEILDLDVHGGKEPQVVVLYYKPKVGRRLVVLGPVGNVGQEVSIEAAVRQVELTPSGEGIALYGNSQDGQTLQYFTRTPEGPRFAWERRDSHSADYSSSVLAGRSVIWMGFEKITSETRTSSLLGYDKDGDLLWNLALESEEGAYLYAKGYSETKGLMAVGTDDGRLSLFDLNR